MIINVRYLFLILLAFQSFTSGLTLPTIRTQKLCEAS